MMPIILTEVSEIFRHSTEIVHYSIILHWQELNIIPIMKLIQEFSWNKSFIPLSQQTSIFFNSKQELTIPKWPWWFAGHFQNKWLINNNHQCFKALFAGIWAQLHVPLLISADMKSVDVSSFTSACRSNSAPERYYVHFRSHANYFL